jgi:hypothetical protein
VKVKLTSKVSSFRLDAVTEYNPGDVFEVEDRLFHPEFMEKIEEPIVEPEAAVEPEEKEAENPTPEQVEPKAVLKDEIGTSDFSDVSVTVPPEEKKPKRRSRKKKTEEVEVEEESLELQSESGEELES